VAWEKLCCPKSEGGLRLKRLEEWNRTAMLKHIWSLFAQSGSIWVAWVDSYWLKGRSLWNISIPKVSSWSWKKLFNLRKLLKKFISFKVGEGTSISLWFDLWHPAGRLLVTPRLLQKDVSENFDFHVTLRHHQSYKLAVEYIYIFSFFLYNDTLELTE
jgi:hypothetical protein